MGHLKSLLRNFMKPYWGGIAFLISFKQKIL